MRLNPQCGIFEPYLTSSRDNSVLEAALKVCPGFGYDIDGMGANLFPQATEHVFELGRYIGLFVAQSTNPETLVHASSGGVMSEASIHLLEEKLVDGVFGCKIEYTARGPITRAFIADTREGVLGAQGSKYCPTTMNSLVAGIDRSKKYVFVGLPCQVAALRLHTQQDPALCACFPYVLSSFCGGIRPFTWTNDIIRRLAVDPGEVHEFCYRGGGQPGSLHVTTAAGVRVSYSYPGYTSLSQIPKLRRCACCIDATAELADLSCGDAWLDRWQRTGTPWSILIVRSAEMGKIINKLATKGVLNCQPLTSEEVIASQRRNIDSKKFRQYKRLRIYSALGYRVPHWSQPLPVGNRSYAREAWIIFRKSKLGLFAWRIYRTLKHIWPH